MNDAVLCLICVSCVVSWIWFSVWISARRRKVISTQTAEVPTETSIGHICTENCVDVVSATTTSAQPMPPASPGVEDLSDINKLLAELQNARPSNRPRNPSLVLRDAIQNIVDARLSSNISEVVTINDSGATHEEQNTGTTIADVVIYDNTPLPNEMGTPEHLLHPFGLTADGGEIRDFGVVAHPWKEGELEARMREALNYDLTRSWQYLSAVENMKHTAEKMLRDSLTPELRAIICAKRTLGQDENDAIEAYVDDALQKVSLELGTRLRELIQDRNRLFERAFLS